MVNSLEMVLDQQLAMASVFGLDWESMQVLQTLGFV